MPNTIPDSDPARAIDHTLLTPTTTAAQVEELCEQAVEYGFAAVCVPPVFVRQSADLLYGSSVAVATVIGFPCGFHTTTMKAAEADLALAQGAAELDMVVSIGAVLEGAWSRVHEDIRAVTTLAAGKVVKVILECCFLNEAQKRRLAEEAIEAGASYLKTSTGFGPGGATLDDVRLLRSIAGQRASVKASGGIRDWPACRAMLTAGAERIGTSSGVRIMTEWQREQRG